MGDSTRSILQRIGFNVEGLNGLDFEKTTPLPDDVTDLNTFLTPGIYLVEHPENVANSPFTNGTYPFGRYPYILMVAAKLDAAPTWCQQYAVMGNLRYIRYATNYTGVVSEFDSNAKWEREATDKIFEKALAYGNGIYMLNSGSPTASIQAPANYAVPIFVTAYTEDNAHFAYFAVLRNFSGTDSTKWIVKPIVSDPEISLTPISAYELQIAISGSLLSYNRVIYSRIGDI